LEKVKTLKQELSEKQLDKLFEDLEIQKIILEIRDENERTYSPEKYDIIS